MSQVIAYTNAQGGVVIVNPAPGIDPATLISTVVPSGITGYVVDLASLPSSPQSMWSIDSTGKITSITPKPTGDQVDAERDRRMYGGFVYGGVVYQSGTVDIANITGAGLLAFMAGVAGAKTGDYTWAGGTGPFQWIAANNTFVSMDAQTVVAFAKAAAAFRTGLIVAARLAKNALAAGQTVDIYADTTWGQDSTSPTSTAASDPSGASQTPSSASSASTSSTSTTPAQGASTTS